MTVTTASRANNTGLPASRREAKTLLTQTEWDDLRDALVLALDALGDGPKDVDGPYLLNCVMHGRCALRLAHKVKERMEKGATQ